MLPNPLQRAKHSFQAPSSLPLNVVNWPDVPGYGVDHAQKTAQLTKYLAESLNISEPDKKVLWAISMLHDIGRQAPHNQPDPNHYTRSASLAEEVLKQADQEWSHHAFISEVCKLIASHGYKEQTNDPRLLIFHDAERLEICRFNINTKEGLRAISSTCAHQFFYTNTCKNIDFVRAWMQFRGWTV